MKMIAVKDSKCTGSEYDHYTFGDVGNPIAGGFYIAKTIKTIKSIKLIIEEEPKEEVGNGEALDE